MYTLSAIPVRSTNVVFAPVRGGQDVTTSVRFFVVAACAALAIPNAFGQTLHFPVGYSIGKTPAPAAGGSILFVDDDGVQCPGALRTIQEAVAQAQAGSAILVCPGTYRKSVKVIGSGKEGLQLIALGREDDVVLAGDHTQAQGIYLEDVQNVLIRGFTIRDFGNKPTTASQYGNGCSILLANSHYSTIENNRVTLSDMDGITLWNSGHNVVRYNFAFETDPHGFGIGMRLDGRLTAGNFIFQNYAYLQPGAGILVWGAGPDNVIADNNFNNNGQFGISHRNTGGTVIEGNRFSYNSGAWGVIGFLKDRRSIGIELLNSDKVTVRGNMVHGNTALDISWDKKGDIVFANNACGLTDQPGLCAQ